MFCGPLDIYQDTQTESWSKVGRFGNHHNCERCIIIGKLGHKSPQELPGWHWDVALKRRGQYFHSVHQFNHQALLYVLQ